jgi:hypothetical protein
MSEWRLPTIEELRKMYAAKLHNNLRFYRSDNAYLSSTITGENQVRCLFMLDGYEADYQIDDYFYARLVKDDGKTLVIAQRDLPSFMSYENVIDYIGINFEKDYFETEKSAIEYLKAKGYKVFKNVEEV